MTSSARRLRAPTGIFDPATWPFIGELYGKERCPANPVNGFCWKHPTDSYRVGHGRPPKHTQFKPGQSGNPTDTAIALTIIPLVISMFKGGDEDDGELTGQQQALIENF